MLGVERAAEDAQLAHDRSQALHHACETERKQGTYVRDAHVEQWNTLPVWGKQGYSCDALVNYAHSETFRKSVSLIVKTGQYRMIRTTRLLS